MKFIVCNHYKVVERIEVEAETESDALADALHMDGIEVSHTLYDTTIRKVEN